MFRKTRRFSRQREFFPDRSVGVDTVGLDVGYARFAFLPHIDAIHKIVPRGGSGKVTDELERLGLHAMGLRFCCRHEGNSGRALRGGKGGAGAE